MDAASQFAHGRFASAEVEEEFRGERIQEDLKLARLLLWLVGVAIPIFLLNDWTLYGRTSLFPAVLAIRLFAVVSTAVFYLRLRRAITPRVLDMWLLAWSGIVLFLLLFSLATRPVSLMNHAITVLAIMMVSLLAPMRFGFQSWTAALFALVAMGLFLAKEPGRFMRLEILTGVFLAVIVGIKSSEQLQRSRREAFLARLSERKTTEELKEAIANVRTLEGILPICASCKKIRRVDGDWSRLEVYVSEHTNARFSHGLCPACIQKHYPEVVT